MKNIVLLDKKDLEECIDFFLRAAGKMRGKYYKWQIIVPENLKDDKASPTIAFEMEVENIPPPPPQLQPPQANVNKVKK